MIDIVYILKKDVKSDELRYSLRSVCQNFPHDRVWFYGSCPLDIYPDKFIEVDQKGVTTWEKVTYTLKRIFENDELAENFWLFNDDFFIMKPIDIDSEYYKRTLINGSLDHQVKGIITRNHGPSKYTDRLKKAAATLRNQGYDSLNYAMHVPIFINRKKGLDTLAKFPRVPMFRSLYGNMHKVPAILHRDVKLIGMNELPDYEWPFLSTSDGSFKSGKVGEYIRGRFPEKCKYEDAQNLQSI